MDTNVFLNWELKKWGLTTVLCMAFHVTNRSVYETGSAVFGTLEIANHTILISTRGAILDLVPRAGSSPQQPGWVCLRNQLASRGEIKRAGVLWRTQGWTIASRGEILQAAVKYYKQGWNRVEGLEESTEKEGWAVEERLLVSQVMQKFNNHIMFHPRFDMDQKLCLSIAMNTLRTFS